MTFAPSNKCNNFISDETLDIGLPNNSMDFEDIFSDVQLLFDFKDDEDELLSENGGNLSWSQDVVVCDPMMTDAVIIPKSESCEINDSPTSFEKQFGKSSPNLNCDLLPNVPTLRKSGMIISHNEIQMTHNFKRQRNDSTDAFDHEPLYYDEPLLRRTTTVEVQAYENPNGSNHTTQRSLIRPNVLPLSVGSGTRSSIKYVLRRQDNNSTGESIFLSGQNSSNSNSLLLPASANRPMLFRNRGSNRINSRVYNSANHNNNSSYVLYPPTPPSSAHCSSDSDDASSLVSANQHICNNSNKSSRTNPSYGMFDHCISQSNEFFLSEEERRTFIAEGFPIPSKFPLTKQEERCLKKVRRKIKNKISAQESRRKKKEYLESLEKKIEHYSREYGDMKRRCETLEASNKSLVFQLRNLQCMIGKASSSTGTCLMVFVLCFALLLGSNSKSENGDGFTQNVVLKASPPRISTLNTDRAILPALWLPEWSPRLGYSRLKHVSHTNLESELMLQCKAGPVEPFSNIPPSRVLFDADEEAYTAYGPQMFNLWIGSISVAASPTKTCQVEISANLSLPLTPQPKSLENQSAPISARLSLTWHVSKHQPTQLLNTTF